MHRNIRQTAISGLLGSKRFIVAVCAAIAMVLGAMSVGASLFVPQSAAESAAQTANASVFIEHKGEANDPHPSENGGVFTNQHALVPETFQLQQTATPQATAPKVKANLSIEFGPVNLNSGLSLGGLQLKIDATSLTPTIELPSPELQESVPVKPPASSEMPAAEDTPREEAPSADSTLPQKESDPQPVTLMSPDATIPPDKPSLN